MLKKTLAKKRQIIIKKYKNTKSTDKQSAHILFYEKSFLFHFYFEPCSLNNKIIMGHLFCCCGFMVLCHLYPCTDIIN